MIEILTLLVSCATLALLIIDRVKARSKPQPQEQPKEKKDNTEAKKNRDEIERKLKAIEDFK
ncbi:MAG: hypothetical protein R3Y18_00135 [Bacillota bacterium]